MIIIHLVNHLKIFSVGTISIPGDKQGPNSQGPQKFHRGTWKCTKYYKSGQ